MKTHELFLKAKELKDQEIVEPYPIKEENYQYVISFNLLNDECKELAKNNEKQNKEWNLLKRSSYNMDLAPVDTIHFNIEEKKKIIDCIDKNQVQGCIYLGDNLSVMSSLIETYKNTVKCIYIDPPYNTGKNGFAYFDNFSSASWLAMMENRLTIAREFLSDDGVIFVSIDDNEQARLKLLMDEIFRSGDFICNFSWEKNYSPKNNANYASKNHDYILSYAHDKEILKDFNRLERTEKNNKEYKYNDFDGRGYYRRGDLTAPSQSKNNYQIKIYKCPETSLWKKIEKDEHHDYEHRIYTLSRPKEMNWRKNEQDMYQAILENRIYLPENGIPQEKKYLSEVGNIVSKTILEYEIVGHNELGTDHIKELFNKRLFSFPKPEKLISYLIKLVSNQTNDLILDFFLGSGTTTSVAHKMRKKYIGIEAMDNTFSDVIIPRMKHVLFGEQGGMSKDLEWNGGGIFKYYFQ